MANLELLNAGKILAALNPIALSHLTELEILTAIDSTNSHLLNKLGLSTGHACLAEQQTAGRGRHNKRWHSPSSNNIYLSLGWHFAHSKQLNGLSIAIGVAVANTLINYGLANIGLKWPNDVWYRRQKLAGILVEIIREPNNSYRAIIGIGINVETPTDPTAIDQPWTDIATIMQKTPDRNLLAGCLLNELLNDLPLFQKQGLTPFLAQWRQYDILLNNPVTVYYQHKQLNGIATGIDQNGNLLVDFDGLIKPVFSGEVSVRFNNDQTVIT